MSTTSLHLSAKFKDIIVEDPVTPDDHTLIARGRRRFRVLIADNDEPTLRVTKDHFEVRGFDTITVRSAHAARLVIQFHADDLDAIILDLRLTEDKNQWDRSGYTVAVEMLERFGYLPPVVIFSVVEDERGEFQRPGITFVSKRKEGYEVLTRSVIEAIRLRESSTRRRARPSYSTTPVVILDDQGGAAPPLLEELGNQGIYAQPCPDLRALLDAAPHLPAAMFIIDIDGARRGERLDAIRRLRELQEESGQTFYVAAFASRAESKQEAAQAGPDVFLVKDTPETDALEIVTRMAQHKRALERMTAESAQRRLAGRWYEELVRQLREVRDSPERGLASATEIVQRALNMAFLEPLEQLVLTSLYTQMLSSGGRMLDAGTVDLCVEGAQMLTDDGARGADVHGWLERAQRHSPDFTLSWLDEEFYDDPEEGIK